MPKSEEILKRSRSILDTWTLGIHSEMLCGGCSRELLRLSSALEVRRRRSREPWTLCEGKKLVLLILDAGTVPWDDQQVLKSKKWLYWAKNAIYDRARVLTGGAGGVQNRQRGSETQNKARRDKFLSWRCNSVSRLEKSLYRAKKWVYGHVMVFG